MTVKDWKTIAQILHRIEPSIGGDWYEVVNEFARELLSEAEDFDTNEFRRIAAGGKP